MPSLVLTYFDSPGRAEPIRVALRMAGLPFVDRRLKFPEFAQARTEGAFPLGAVPVLEVDGVKVVQTGAILRYVARIGAPWLYPTDPLAALTVDSVIDSFNDTLSTAMLPSLFERDPAKKLAMRAELAAGPLARVYGYVEGILARSGGPFVTGSELSVADLVVALGVQSILSGRLDGLTAEHLAPFPRLLNLAAAYGAHPQIRAAGAS